MAPEHEARMRVLYDHESEETGRRRRAVADWGVGEDIFDRMPSRRFTRAERRSAHTGTVVISREPEAVRVEVEPGQEPWAEPRRFAREPEPRRAEREPEAEPRRAEREPEAEPRRVAREPEPRRAEREPEPEPRRFEREPEPRREREVESWFEAEPDADLAPAEPPARLVAVSTHPEPAPAPAIPEVPDHEPPARRTVVISGHPGGVPAARPARPPRTAVERVGTRPDRIVAYAVALGFLLVLIAILTTGQ